MGGRITREDIAREVAKRDAQKAKQDVATEQNTISTVAYSSRSEKRVPMTRLRKRIAERLLEAKKIPPQCSRHSMKWICSRL